jgi:hypothetical protein
MNGNFTVELSQVSLIINVVLRVITAIIFFAFIIPLQIKQVHVRNGLKLLRTELLVSGIILFLVNTIGLFIIVVRPYVDPVQLRIFTDFIALFNSFGFFAIAIIKFQIYNSQYTPENILLHEHLHKIEQRVEKNIARQEEKKAKKKV